VRGRAQDVCVDLGHVLPPVVHVRPLLQLVLKSVGDRAEDRGCRFEVAAKHGGAALASQLGQAGGDHVLGVNLKERLFKDVRKVS
jgi:hypothetical protein